MENSGKLKQWQETQTQWDDTDFLQNKANALMKARWKRLNKNIASIIEKLVVEKNEYITLLDAGAGRGDFYRLVENSLKKYTGIEPSEKMLPNDIREEEIEILRGTAEEMNYENEYDACLFKEVLDHCYDPEKALKNSYAALKTGGIVIISLTNRDSYYKLLFKKHAQKLEEEHKDHINNFNPADVVKLCADAGFTAIKVKSTNYLRLPSFLEKLTGRLPLPLVFFILDATDALMRPFLNNKGGSFIITAEKSGGCAV